MKFSVHSRSTAFLPSMRSRVDIDFFLLPSLFSQCHSLPSRASKYDRMISFSLLKFSSYPVAHGVLDWMSELRCSGWSMAPVDVVQPKRDDRGDAFVFFRTFFFLFIDFWTGEDDDFQMKEASSLVLGGWRSPSVWWEKRNERGREYERQRNFCSYVCLFVCRRVYVWCP